MARKRKTFADEGGIRIKGMFRVHLVDSDGTIAGDSGWVPNAVTNLGMQHFIAGPMAANANSSYVNYMALGTGTVPGAADTTLHGEVMSSTQRVTVAKTYSSRSATNGTATQYFYATFASGFVTGAGSNIANVGLFKSNVTNDTLFAGNTFSSSACASNQAANVTYQIQFS